jgi:hypothetical protein
MYKFPRCNKNCPTYDELNKTCMFNRVPKKLFEDSEEGTKARWTNPAACFDELG